MGDDKSQQRKQQQEAMRRLLERALRTPSGSRGKRWTRDELHEREEPHRSAPRGGDPR